MQTGTNLKIQYPIWYVIIGIVTFSEDTSVSTKCVGPQSNFLWQFDNGEMMWSIFLLFPKKFLLFIYICIDIVNNVLVLIKKIMYRHQGLLLNFSSRLVNHKSFICTWHMISKPNMLLSSGFVQSTSQKAVTKEHYHNSLQIKGRLSGPGQSKKYSTSIF